MIVNHLHIKKLILTQFRNYKYQSIEFVPQINVLTGHNGMGKTNILDAVYMLCLGKSYFNSSDSHIMMFESDFYRLESLINKEGTSEKVVIKSQTGKRKEIEISGKKQAKLKDHIGLFPCVIMAPDDIHDLLNTSEERRNFINNTLVQLDANYLEDLIIYTTLLKQRNATLKSFQDTKTFNPTLLDALSERMYEPAQNIYVRRKQFINDISPDFQTIYKEISGGNEVCSLKYESQLDHSSFEKLLKDHKEKDRILGRTTSGIHKDDILFIMDDLPLKTYASQGQLKSFVLTLKLAQYQYLKKMKGQKPILLLDDIFDKLDPQRVSQLLHIVASDDFGQVIITDTQKDRIHKVLEIIETPHKLLHVENGVITENF